MIIDIHGHLGNINFAKFWQADAPTLERYCDESNTDLLCLSSSRSIMYDVREGNAELDKALKNGFNYSGPYVIDCAIDKDEFVLPMLPPGGSMDDIIVKVGQ